MTGEDNVVRLNRRSDDERLQYMKAQATRHFFVLLVAEGPEVAGELVAEFAAMVKEVKDDLRRLKADGKAGSGKDDRDGSSHDADEEAVRLQVPLVPDEGDSQG